MRYPLAIICKVVGHRPDRKRSWHDQMNWRSNCKTCRFGLIRDRHGWREFKAADYSTVRQSKDEVRFPSNRDWAWAASISQPDPDNSNKNDGTLLIADHTGQNVDQSLLPSPSFEDAIPDKVPL
jgi:hypothetical protein